MPHHDHDSAWPCLVCFWVRGHEANCEVLRLSTLITEREAQATAEPWRSDEYLAEASAAYSRLENLKGDN